MTSQHSLLYAGLSNGTAAALMLTDVLADRDNPWLAVFDATRIGDGHRSAS